MNQEEDECSFGKTRKYFSSGLQPASMGKLWGAVRKKSATLNLDKHIENPSACSLGNAVFGLCLQKALWLLSESWGRGGSCFQGWACGWEDLWCLVLASPIWCCLLTPAGMGVRSSEKQWNGRALHLCPTWNLKTARAEATPHKGWCVLILWIQGSWFLELFWAFGVFFVSLIPANPLQ